MKETIITFTSKFTVAVVLCSAHMTVKGWHVCKVWYIHRGSRTILISTAIDSATVFHSSGARRMVTDY